MDIDYFSRQLSAMRGRILSLMDRANSPSYDIVPSSFKELGVASEELSVALEELQE